MSETITLPSGNWISLRDWRELRRGDKKKALGQVEDPERLIAATYDLADGLLILMIENWSYEGLLIPRDDPSSLDRLPMEDDNALMQAIQPAVRALFPKAAEATEEQVADPASPTEPSDG
jgi:hypothetical protein